MSDSDQQNLSQQQAIDLPKWSVSGGGRRPEEPFGVEVSCCFASP